MNVVIRIFIKLGILRDDIDYPVDRASNKRWIFHHRLS
jgi:hypothetical protein